MRKIIHIDMDCFYAAVEMRDNPKLRNVPIAIGGRSDKRGVISTANYIARRYGVHSAMSTAKALKLCPQLVVVAGRMDVYRAVSQQIKAIFYRYTALVEPLSLDEAYLDVTDSPHCQGSATLMAQEIREAIFNELGLTASAGIAPVKFLAKIASDLNKPNGQYVLTPEQIPDFIATLSLKKIPGVGKVSAARLQEHNLVSCADVQKADLPFLLKEFGKLGRVLWERSQGIDPRPVSAHWKRKSVAVERTLEYDINSWEACQKLVDEYYPELERRLAKERPDLRIAKQGVKLKFDDFQSTTIEHNWPKLNKEDLMSLAHQVWHQRREGRNVRLFGLQVTLLDEVMERQLLLPLDEL